MATRASPPGATVTYTFDAKDRLTKDETSGTDAHTYNYTYDSRDNILTNDESGTIVTFAYDAASRLTTSISGSTVTTYTFDSNGNMTLAHTGTSRTTITYDKENRALTWRAGSTSTNTTWKYNGLGQKIYENTGPVLGTHGLVWDGNDYLGQVAVGAEDPYVFLNLIRAVDGVMFGQATDFMVDYLGSITGTTNVTTGAIVNTYRYKPYGSTLSGSPSAVGFFWTGNTGSRRTGCNFAEQYNRAKHYSSRTNQWISRDPLWPDEPAFGYVEGNPVRWLDYYGLWKLEFQDCSKSQQETIRAMFETELNDSRLTGFLDCLDCTHVRLNSPTRYGSDAKACIENFMNGSHTLKIDCSPGHVQGCDNRTCGATWFNQNPPLIVLCENAFKVGRCGALSCLLIHEAIHACGSTHGGDNSNFECVSKVPNCKDWTGTHTPPVKVNMPQRL